MEIKIKTETILDGIYQNVKKNPEKIAIIWLNEQGEQTKKITYQEFWRQSLIVSHKLQQWNLQKGDHTVLILPPSIKFYIIFIGCIHTGVVAVPTYPPIRGHFNRDIPKITYILENNGAKIVITSNSIKRLLMLSSSKWPSKIILKTITKLYQKKKVQKFNHHLINSNDLAFLQYTSGSTSEPKGVMVTHNNLLHNIRIITKHSGTNENSIGVSWLPQYHDYGLISTLHILFNGSMLYLMSPLTFLHNPLLWLKIISEKKATVTGAPFFAYSLILKKWKNQFPLNLQSLQYLQCAGEPINKEIIENFLEMFSSYGLKKEIFCPSYGLAEHVVYVTDHPKLTPLKISQGKIACGLLFEDDIVVKIVNPETFEECIPGKEGEIWVDSPSKALGYWGLSDINQKIFQASILSGKDEKKYLRTGDLGYIEDNWLFVTGRIKDVIIINGKNFYPQDIEYIISKCSECIKPGGVVAFSMQEIDMELVIVVVEVREQYTKNKKLLEELINYIYITVTEQQIPVTSIQLVKEKTIPKTTSGKVRRQETKKKYINNELKIIISKNFKINIFQINEKIKEDTCICIIGAGPSGLSAAKFLQDRGYTNIIVLEKENNVGGKINGFKYNNSWINFGMYFIATGGYTETLALSKELNIELKSLSSTEGVCTDFEIDGLKKEKFINFLKYMMNNYNDILKPGHFGNIGDLWKNTDEWINNHPESEAISSFFTSLMAAGKGTTEIIPMSYYAKLIFFGISPIYHVLPNGYNNLFYTLAKKLQEINGTKIILNCSINYIERNERVIIHTKEIDYVADKVIIACPLDDILPYLDATKKEKNLIEKIKYTDYVITYCKIKNVPFKLFLYKNMNCKNVGHLIYLSGAEPSLKTELFQTAQYGTDFITGKKIETEELKKILVKDIENLGGYIVEIYHVHRWKYFAHISSEDMASGWHNEFNFMQGVKNTFYTNPVLNFETVEKCLEFSKYLVTTYFPILKQQSIIIKDLNIIDKNDITLLLQETLSRSLGLEKLPEINTPLNEFGLQSLQLVEISRIIEEKLQTPLSPTIVLQSNDIKSLSNLIYQEIKGNINEEYYEGTEKISIKDNLFYNDDDKKLTKKSNMPYFLLLIFQFLGLFIKPYLILLSLIPVYYFLYYIYINFGIYPTIACLPIGWIIYSICSCIIIIIIKWIVIGKFKPQIISIWGSYYFCWWFVNHCYQIIYPAYPLIQETMFINIFYRLLGSRIGKNVIIKGELREWDLIYISDNTIIEKGTLVTGSTSLKSLKLKFGKVNIGENCVIGASSCIGPGSVIPNFYELPPFSSSPSLWTTAKPLKKDIKNIESLGFFKTIVGILIIGILNTISIIPIIFIIWLLLFNYNINENIKNIYITIIILTSAIILAFLVLVGPIYGLLIFLTKYSINLIQKKNFFTEWLLYRLMESIFQTWWIAFWVWTPIITLYYKILGAKIGKNCLLTRIQTINHEYITIGNNTNIGGEVFIYANKENEVKIGNDCLIANNVIIQPGVILEEKVTLGTYTLAIKEKKYIKNTTWLGSPSLCLQSLVKKIENTKNITFYQYLIPFFAIIALLIIINLSILPSFEFFLLILKKCGIKSYITIPLFIYITFLFLCIITIILKWIIIGNFTGIHDFWSNYFIRWRIMSILILFLHNIVIRDFLGTPFINLWYQLMGSKIGKKVCILSDSEDNPHFETDSLRISDYVVLGYKTILLGHVIDNNKLQIFNTNIGEKTCIGTKTIVQPGVLIDSSVSVGEQSLVIKGQRLTENTLWKGNPIFCLNNKLIEINSQSESSITIDV